jgi:hypothetical protein
VVVRRIEDLVRDAAAENDAMGADEYVRQSALVWACQCERGSGHADFSVYGENRRYLWDIEFTALFTTPAKKNAEDYEDYSPYPVTPVSWNVAVSGVSLRDIDHPRTGFRPYGRLERVIETHLRDRYPPYWLVIYDNEHGVTDLNLAELKQRIYEILEKRAGGGRLPANLKQVWAFDWPNYGKTTLMRVWP